MDLGQSPIITTQHPGARNIRRFKPVHDDFIVMRNHRKEVLEAIQGI
jgi:hypothetical protein